MVILEVAQAVVSEWTPKEKGANVIGRDIFLEVYFEHTRRKSCLPCCSCRMATSDGPERDPFLTQVKLEPVKESREMVWRNYTKDDFLDKLFLLEGTKFGRTLSRGERLTLVADVYRSSTISEAGQHHADVDPEDKAQWPSEGSSRVLTEFVCKMRGILEVGVWGTLTLPCAAHEDGLAAGPGDDRDAEDMPSLTLELRPRSMRPFSLEYCRPDCPTLAAAEDCFGRKHRDSVCSVLTEEEVDRKSREDSSIAKQNSSSFRFGSGMRSSSYLARDSVVEDAGFHASTSAPSPPPSVQPLLASRLRQLWTTNTRSSSLTRNRRPAGAMAPPHLPPIMSCSRLGSSTIGTSSQTSPTGPSGPRLLTLNSCLSLSFPGRCESGRSRSSASKPPPPDAAAESQRPQSCDRIWPCRPARR
mmetsp:Transcript_1581/g.4658  ORF Transcript_1581/g.4658 Transcript_1581/m.4658 type:complete len:415 (-) Transcript_1581:436-1680(-)